MLPISEEDQLKVKFVIDDTEFRDQLGRLRQDLEGAERIEPGQARRPETRPSVEVMIGGRGGVDADVIRRIDDLEKRAGLPAQLLETTLGGMLENLRKSIESGFFGGANQRSLDLLVRGVEEIVNKFGADTRTGELQGGQFNPIFAGLRNLMDIINRRTPLGGRMEGLPKHVTEFIQNISKGMISITQPGEGGRPARTGISHAGLEALSIQVLKALGKDPVAELPLMEEIGGKKVLQGIMDVMSSFGLGVFDEEGREFKGYHVTEVATGFSGRDKERQVGNYANLIMGYAYKDFHSLDQEEYVDPKVVDTWFKGPVIDAMTSRFGEDSKNWPEMFKVGILHTGGVSKELSRTRIESSLKTRPGARKLLETGLMRPVFFKVPEEALLEAFIKFDPDIDPEKSTENFGADILGQLKKAGMWNELIDFYNPLNVPREELEGIFEEIVNQRLTTLRASGGEVDINVVREIFTKLGDVTGATRTDVMRLGDSRYDTQMSRRGRRGRRPKIGVRIGRLEQTVLEELLESYEELTEEEQIEGVYGAITMPREYGGVTEEERERIRLRTVLHEANPEARERLARFLHDNPPPLTPEQEARMLEMQGGEDDMARGSLEFMGPVGGIGMEIDFREYIQGMEKYAKEIKKEFGIPMTKEKYVRWALEKSRGRLPGDIMKGPTGDAGLIAALDILKNIELSDSEVPSHIQRFLSEREMGDPIGRKEWDMIRDEMSRMREVLAVGVVEHGLTQMEGDLIVRVSKELESFEKIYTRLEPATSIMLMTWS